MNLNSIASAPCSGGVAVVGTHLRKIILGGAAAALMMSGAVSKSFAVEPGDFTNYLRGATQGLPSGGLPPPGLYGGFGLDVTGLGSSPGKGNQATAVATNPAPGYGFIISCWYPAGISSIQLTQRVLCKGCISD